MTTKPLVSICCTCKDAEQTIRRHLDSIVVVFSCYDNLEYIVQDGGSTDATLNIIEEYSQIFGDKMHLVSEQDSCASDGFWRALSRCRGDIICASLADEELLPDAIPQVVDYFFRHPNSDVIHGDIYQTDIDGNIQFANPSKTFDLGGYLSHQIPMHFAASFFRRNAFVKSGLLPLPNKYGLIIDDFEIWVYLGITSCITYYPVVFAKYAVHDSAISVRSDRVVDNMARRLSFIESIFNNEALPEKVRANKAKILSNFYHFAINLMCRANLVGEAQKYIDTLAKMTSDNTLTYNNEAQGNMSYTNSPILFLIFNRPEPTEQVFQTIRSARPRRLYVAADGPRDTVPSDIEQCANTREIINHVDWPCEVNTLFRDSNYGCKYAVSSAITWFFEHEEEGIILEDDCLPDISFFRYCDELLEKYRHDSRIGTISGDNFQFGRNRTEASYYFSRFTHIWGWATWRRAWKFYDVEMKLWPRIRDNGFMNDILDTQEEVSQWSHIFESTYTGQINTWDYQLMFACWVNSFLNILPCRNLVKNIGFDANGTHITSSDSPFSNMETVPMQFPLKPPDFIIRDAESDIYSARTTFGIPVPVGILKYVGLDHRKQSHLQGDIMPSDAHTAVMDLYSKATMLFNEGNYKAALEYVISAKAIKVTRRGLDFLRAHCFIQLGQTSGALEALREELRWFPDNTEAKILLDSIVNEPQSITNSSCFPSEFLQLLDVIRPYTMLSEQRLYSLYNHAKYICENNIQGNFVECGVAAGGSSALLAWVIKNYSCHPRKLFSFDSFSGMPRPTEFDSSGGIDAESTGWGTGTCAAPESSVIEICTKLGVVDIITTVKGYFEDTLPQMRDWVGMVALLHMDGDWYESTKAILNNLYDRLVNGAFIQVDDYGHWDGCRKAIHEFAAARALQFEMNQIDSTGVWFVKPDMFKVNEEIPKALVDDFMQDDPVRQGIVSQMSANERFQLYYTVRTMLPMKRKPLRFIEIGSFSGASLILICRALRRLATSYQGVSVEPGGTIQFHEVIKSLKESVIHLPMFSHDAALRLSMMFDEGGLPELIFVDGDHTYEGVKQDIIDYYQLLAPGGIMLFHDFLPELDDTNRAAIYFHHGNSEPGIRKACYEVLEATYRIKPVELPLLYPDDPTQTQQQLPIIPGVFSTVRAYIKPLS